MRRIVTVGLLSSVVWTPVIGQTPPNSVVGPLEGPQIAAAFEGPCFKIVSEMGSRGLGAQVLKVRPTDIASVCGCVREKFLGDSRLQERLTVETDVLSLRMEGTHLRSYMDLRIFQATLACTADDLERSLQAAKPEK